jgi:hypothetical protein
LLKLSEKVNEPGRGGLCEIVLCTEMSSDGCWSQSRRAQFSSGSGLAVAAYPPYAEYPGAHRTSNSDLCRRAVIHPIRVQQPKRTSKLQGTGHHSAFAVARPRAASAAARCDGLPALMQLSPLPTVSGSARMNVMQSGTSSAVTRLVGVCRRPTSIRNSRTNVSVSTKKPKMAMAWREVAEENDRERCQSSSMWSKASRV